MEQIYCSENEIREDLGELGLSESRILSKITAASQEILRDMGQWLPVIETHYFEGEGCNDEILVPPLLSVSGILNQSIALSSTDYLLQPDGRHWRNGPYSSIELSDVGSLGAWSELDRGVAVSGKWGRYDEATSLGLSVSQSLADVTLVVTDGSLVSPGMVLLIGSEWELVTSTGAATASTATLSADMDAVDGSEEFAVSDGTKIKAGELIKIGFELMRVLDVTGNDIQASRAVNGSKRAAHSSGAAVNVFRTFNVLRGVNGSTAAAHTGAAVSRQIPPADVNYLAREIASLMIKKSQTGYTGRSGNEATGTEFFISEFPKTAIQAIKDNYFWGGV